MAVIRQRRKADGTFVYDANGSYSADGRNSSLHLGTFATKAEAEEVLDDWHRAAERDKAILRERQDQTPTDGAYRWHLASTVSPHRARKTTAAEWSDPTADIAIARADRWLAARRRAS